MPMELWWLIRVCSAVYIAWRATMLIGVNNPLMAILFAIVFSIAAPVGLDFAIDGFGNSGDFTAFWEGLRTVKALAPLCFGLLGVFCWAGVEQATGQ